MSLAELENKTLTIILDVDRYSSVSNLKTACLTCVLAPEDCPEV